MRTYRLMTLLDHLRRRSAPVSAEVLAAETGVSVRTLYRDMATLQGMGVPVRGEAGVGYRLEKGAFLPPLSFDPDELDAVMLGLRLVAARGDAPLAQAARRVTGKIAAALPEDRRDAYTRLPWRAASRGAAPTADGADDGRRHLDVLRTAVRDRAVLRLAYRDAAGRASDRTVHPLGLTVFDTVWLLTAWCETRDAFRDFRLDRITAVAPTGTTFAPLPGRRFEDYLATLA